jgi:hypothetical protein
MCLGRSLFDGLYLSVFHLHLPITPCFDVARIHQSDGIMVLPPYGTLGSSTTSLVLYI